MYRCDDCGVDFYKPKIVKDDHGFGDGLYERFTVCPNCNSAFWHEEENCLLCGESFDMAELHHGMCEDCIVKQITYTTFHAFATQEEPSAYTPDEMQDFMFSEVFFMNPIQDSSKELRAEIKELYKRKVAHERLTGRDEFLKQIRSYVANNDDVLEGFAEWLLKVG